MALDSYANLQTAILQGLARPGDPLVAPAIPDLIRLFEAEAKRRLKIGAQEHEVTYVDTVGGTATVALPEDCGAIRSVELDGVPLLYLAPSSSGAMSRGSGSPRYYTLYGSNARQGASGMMRLTPTPDGVYTIAIDYLADLPGLSDSHSLNWLLESYPDLYYFGVMAEAEMYVGHDERVTMWMQRRDLAFASIEKADIKARWSGPLQLRADGITIGGVGGARGSSGGGGGGGNGGNGGAGVAYLDDLLDVDTGAATPGMVLTYTAPNWVAASPGATAANAPIIADGGITARPPSARAADVISIKEYSPGDAIADPSDIAAWVDTLASGYTHGNGAIPAITARGGYIPGGLWDAGTPTVIGSQAFGYSLFGDGRISQLKNVTVENMHVNVRLRDFGIMGNGTGKGLDVRSANMYAYGVDLSYHDICIANNRGSFAGGLGGNNTVMCGLLRDARIGAVLANPDMRLMFMRSSFLTECGIDCRDSGGNHLLGNNIYCETGPSIRWSGGQFTFNGNTTIGSFVITNITDFTNIRLDDVVSSVNTLPLTTRVTAINQGAGTITVDLAALATHVAVKLDIVRVPIESFYVDNTFNSGRTDRLEFPIASIRAVNPAVPSAGIRVVTTNQNFKIALGTNRIRFRDTGITIYNDDANATTRWVTAIEDWNTVVLNVPYAGDVTGVGKMLCNNFDGEVHSGDISNSAVREHFFVGNNINQTLWQGGVAFNMVGTRLNGRITFDGFRQFRGTATIGSKIVTAITGINTNELRNGVMISSTTASFPRGTLIESVNSPTQITLSNAATEDAANTQFFSPHTPNGWFHIGFIDNATMVDLGVTRPTGPGSTVGWSQIAMFPDFDPNYTTPEGGYWVGARVPYTSGGMKDGQAQYLNEIGPTNTGIHIRSNSVKHFLRGKEWVFNDPRTFTVLSIATANSGASILLTLKDTCPLIIGVDRVYLTLTGVVGYDGVEAIVEAKPRPDQIQLSIAFISNATGTLNTDDSIIIFREGVLANATGAASDVGVQVLSNGRPMTVETRAYRNNGGTIYGNSMFRLRAPRLGTAINETANGGGFVLLPGNSADNTVRLFLGAANSTVDLTGNADAIRALSTGKFEITNNGTLSGYYGSTTPWISFSRTSSSFLGWTTNASSRLIYSNDDTGNAASANIEVRQSSASLQTAVRMAVYSAGFTSAGIAVQDGGAVYSDTSLSGGLSVAALAGNLRLSAAGEIIGDFPTSDPGVPGAIWCDTAAARVLKMSA